MCVKKLYISKQKNNRVFILFPSCYDLSEEKVRNKIQKIAGIFSVNFSVKLTSKNKEIAKSIKAFFPSIDMLINEEKKVIILLFKLSKNNLIKLLECVDYDETSIELFVYYEDLELKQYQYGKENNFDFYMYITDNDGPFILFNKEVYCFDETIAKIKEILQ